MISLFKKWWKSLFVGMRMSQRKTDMMVLWPIIKEQSPNMERAKDAFFWHVRHDPAWTDDYTTQELFDIVDNLA